MSDEFIEQTHSEELQAISDVLRGGAAQGGIDRELVNTLVEHSAALSRIAMLYDVALVHGCPERCIVCGDPEPCSHDFDKEKEELGAIAHNMGSDAVDGQAPPPLIRVVGRSLYKHSFDYTNNLLLTELEEEKGRPLTDDEITEAVEDDLGDEVYDLEECTNEVQVEIIREGDDNDAGEHRAVVVIRHHPPLPAENDGNRYFTTKPDPDMFPLILQGALNVGVSVLRDRRSGEVIGYIDDRHVDDVTKKLNTNTE